MSKPVKFGVAIFYGIVILLALTFCGAVVSSLSENTDSQFTETVVDTEDTDVSPAPKTETKMTVSQRNALKSAQQYLDLMNFSKFGLTRQLTSNTGEGFAKKDVVWALNRMDVDWNAEAVASAEAYLDLQSFSRSGLMRQLTSTAGEGFTKAQATYAVDKVGL